MNEEFLIDIAPLFADRREAGRALAAELGAERGPELVVAGLARGGVEVAAEVARVLGVPLDVVAVRKVGHPWQPEYGIGAVTPGDGVYVRGLDGLTEEQVEAAKAKAAILDRRLHATCPPLELAGRAVVVVDDGLAIAATMVAALRWARAAGAARVVAAVPVGAAQSLELIGAETDELVCLHALERFLAVGLWYESFSQVDAAAVIRLLEESRRSAAMHRRSQVP